MFTMIPSGRGVGCLWQLLSGILRVCLKISSFLWNCARSCCCFWYWKKKTRAKRSLFPEASQCGKVHLWDESQNMALAAGHALTLVLNSLITEKLDSKSLPPNSKNPCICFWMVLTDLSSHLFGIHPVSYFQLLMFLVPAPFVNIILWFTNV